MLSSRSVRNAQRPPGPRAERGQALVYGLFVLVAGLAALFYLFNVGQLTREKTQLVNTSDAVAYSAGVMHARAMNFSAYTNRALVANEVFTAQMVSLASWAQYVVPHGESAVGLGCSASAMASSYGLSCEPVDEGFLVYSLVAMALANASTTGVLATASEAINGLMAGTMKATEASKGLITKAQQLMLGTLVLARRQVLQEVAEANYEGDGKISVDLIPLRDSYQAFGESRRPLLRRYDSLEDRQRLAQVARDAVALDGFTPRREWHDTGWLHIPCPMPQFLGQRNHVDRYGRTGLTDDLDDWVAQDGQGPIHRDVATYHRYFLHFHKPKWGIPWWSCDDSPQELGSGEQSAKDWGYTGIPSFNELSADGLNDPDPRVQFAIRVKRLGSETYTSDARAQIKTSPRLNNYQATPATDSTTGRPSYIGLSASEAFFSRPEGRKDKKNELASLFNPYWQVHLMAVPADVQAQATALQGAAAP